MSKYYTVGKIVNTHGLQGEVRVITISDFKAERYQPGNVLYYFPDHETEEGHPLTLVSWRTHKQFDLLKFEGYTDINAVERFKGGWLKIRAEQRQTLPEGEYYFDQIIGCTVETETGDIIGHVDAILTPGANDVWVVKPTDGKKEILIPYIDDVVKKVDVDQKRIVIHLLEGLLDE